MKLIIELDNFAEDVATELDNLVELVLAVGAHNVNARLED